MITLQRHLLIGLLKTPSWLIGGLVAVGWVPLPATAAPPLYSVRVLERPADSSPATTAAPLSINDEGIVLGRYTNQDYSARMGQWDTSGKFSEIKGFPKKSNQYAPMSLNNAGQIIGAYSTPGSTPTEMYTTSFFLDPQTGYHEIASWVNSGVADYFQPVALNNAGIVAGYGSRDGGRPRLLFWSLTTGVVVPPGLPDESNEPRDFNDRNEVLEGVSSRGYWLVGPELQPARVTAPSEWKRPSQMLVYGMNNRGQVVGQARNKPFMWDPVVGSQPIETKGCKDDRGTAFDINDSEQVVGVLCSEYFYRDPLNGVLPLRKLIDPADPLSAAFYKYAPTKINNRGEVLAAAIRRDGTYEHVVLVPRGN